jgi:hypothetical protein
MKKLQSVWCFVLILAMTFSLAACANVPDRDAAASFPGGGTEAVAQVALDSRVSAAQTFGETNLSSVEAQGQETEDPSALVHGSGILPLSEFMCSFITAKRTLISRMDTAYSLEGKSVNDIIPLDTITYMDYFAIYSAFNDGPEAMLRLWQDAFTGNQWTADYEEDEELSHILLYADGTPTAELYAHWYENDQYFFGTFYTSDYALEMDAVATQFGYACQLYEVGTNAVYHLAFTADGGGDGSLGLILDVFEQPDYLTGQETPAFGADWTGLGNAAGAHHITLVGGQMTVTGFGETNVYALNSQSTEGNNGAVSNADNANTPDALGASVQSAVNASASGLSAEAAPYARVWHGSPVLGSGWSERFALYGDGSFIWGANEMDGETRLRYMAGTWDVKEGQLLLTVALAVGWEGGEVVANNGIASYASEQVILNPTIVSYQIDNEILTLPVGKITRDAERGLDTAVFNELQCWDYTAQGAGAMNGFWQVLMTSQNRAPAQKDRTTPPSAFK